MSRKSLVISITFLAIFAMSARISMDTDTWWHLRAGQWMVENKQILKTDPFSGTRFGSPWEYPGWIVQIPMATIFNTLGPGGLNLWTAILVTLSYAGLWHSLSGGVYLKAFVLIFSAVVSSVFWSARPHMVTFIFTAIFLSIFELYRTHTDTIKFRRFLLVTPILMILWVNSHGGFIVGFIVCLIYWLNQLIRVMWEKKNDIHKFQDFRDLIKSNRSFTLLTLVGFSLVVLSGLNPIGYKILLYPIKTVGITSLQDFIQEWQSPNFHLIYVQTFAWMLMACLVVLGYSRHRVAFVDIVNTSLFAIMGLVASRNIALFALAAPILLTRHIAPITYAVSRKLGFRMGENTEKSIVLGRVNIVILVVLICLVVIKVISILPRDINQAAFRKMLPTDAVNYLNTSQYDGKIFNSYNWGAYLLWALPKYPVFVDGRTDLYDDEIIEQWVKVYRADTGWEDILMKYNVKVVLVEKDSIIAKVLHHDQHWEKIYQDEIAVIFYKELSVP